MPHYITLLRYTQKGIEDIKGGASRLDAARKAFAAGGGKMKEFYLTIGQYDGVAISEFPDDATAARVSLATGSLRNCPH